MLVLLKQIIATLLLVITFSLNAETTLLELEEKARLGDAWAQLNLGAAYDNGFLGLEVDPKKAVVWYKRSAQQGVANAQFNYAHCLATGHGLDQNDVEARVWMKKAAAQKLADAQFLMGVMLKQGIGGGIDTAKAQFWLMRAAKNGQKDAQAMLKKTQ